MEVFGPDGDAGVIIGSTSEQLGTKAYSGYYAGLRTHDGQLVLGRANYGWLELQTVPLPTGIQAQHWYHLEVAAVGCEVAAVAMDVSSGVKSTVTHLPHVILLDLCMPDMDGTAFLQLPAAVLGNAAGDCADQL